MPGKGDKTCSPIRTTGGQVDGERATPTLSCSFNFCTALGKLITYTSCVSRGHGLWMNAAPLW